MKVCVLAILVASASGLRIATPIGPEGGRALPRCDAKEGIDGGHAREPSMPKLPRY